MSKGNELSKADFINGMTKLLALKVESRLSTSDLMLAYSEAISRKISLGAWNHCVSLAISSQLTLPTPVWFLEEAQKYEKDVLNADSEVASREERERLETEFPESVAMKNLERLSLLIRYIGVIKE